MADLISGRIARGSSQAYRRGTRALQRIRRIIRTRSIAAAEQVVRSARRTLYLIWCFCGCPRPGLFTLLGFSFFLWQNFCFGIFVESGMMPLSRA